MKAKMKTKKLPESAALKTEPFAEESMVVREAPTLEPLQVGAFEAKTHLSALLQKVALGHSFTITKHGKAIAELKPPTTTTFQPRKLGQWAGKKGFWMAPDFDAPLEDFKEYLE